MAERTRSSRISRIPARKTLWSIAFAFSGKGEVYSYSTVYDAPEGYEGQAPYTVALVKLEEGPLITAQLADVENGHVSIGQAVEMVTRKLRSDGDKGMIVYGYKFRPVLATA